MTDSFQFADWALVGLTVVFAVLGLFRGFSGTLAFVIAIASAISASVFGWPFSETFSSIFWVRSLGVLVAALLVFGVVRLVVKKLVNGLMAQPSDAIFGFLIGAAMGVAIALVWAYSGMYLEYSYLAQLLTAYV